MTLIVLKHTEIIKVYLVFFLIAAKVKDGQISNVAAQSYNRYDKHYLTIDLQRIQKSLDSLSEEPNQ